MNTMIRALRACLAALLVLVLAACSLFPLPGPGGTPRMEPAAGLAEAPPGARAGQVPAMTGAVSFAGWRHVAATMADVAAAATVSLLDAATSATVATTVTDASGNFSLGFPAQFQPDPSATYILEAVKGLGGNVPGNNAARVRTLVRFAGGWTSISSAAPGPVSLDAGTTAIAIGGALLGAAPATFIGTLAIGSPDTFTSPGVPLTNALYDVIQPLVKAVLSSDLDPVAAIAWSGTTFVRNSTGLAITSVSESTRTVGQALTITGTGFDPTAANDTVTFGGGTTATPTTASATSLTVTVPGGAVTGDLAVTVGGLKVLGPRLAVTPTFASFSASSGDVGASITINGSGFSSTASDNVVTFTGPAAATVTAATATALTVTVPSGAISGTVTLSVVGQAVTTATFTVNVTVSSLSITAGMIGDAVTITGTGFGASIGANNVTFGGAVAPITAASPTSLSVTVPATTTGNVQVQVGVSTASGGNFTIVLPRLDQIQTPVAGAGQLLTLEGQFGGEAVVNFPGGVSVQASASANRAVLSVPMGAGAGDLTVTSHGATTAGASFSASTFTLGPGAPFQYRYIQAEPLSGRQTPVLTGVRNRGQGIVIGRWFYVIGGYNGGFMTSIERAPIDSAGYLGQFATVGGGVQLNTAREAFGVQRIGNYLYVMGGNNSSALKSIERATITGSGDLTTFTTQGGTLTTERAGLGSAVIGNWLYAISGAGGTYLNSIERAQINPDGTIGAFAVVPGRTVSMARADFRTVVIGPYVYNLGGYTTTETNLVERAPIDGSGNLTASFGAVGPTLATPRAYHGAVVLGDKLVCLGGRTGGSTWLDTVEAADIDSRGDVGSFRTLSGVTLSGAIGNFMWGMVGHHLYVAGGFPLTRKVQRLATNTSGAVGPFATVSGSPFSVKRRRYSTAVVGPYLYVIGGEDENNAALGTVERATINPDGTLSAFADVPTVTLSTARLLHGCAVVSPYVYCLGGANGTYQASVESATINADGSLTGFAATGLNMTTPREMPGLVVAGDYLYAIGGYNGGFLSGSERFAIAADGTLSGPEAGGTNLTGGRSNFGIAAIGPYVYVYGGNPGVLDTVERSAFLSAEGDLGNFTSYTGSTLATARWGAASAIVGDYLYVLGGYDSGSLGSVERAAIDATGYLGPFATVPGVSITARAVLGTLVAGNYLYALGGGDSATMTLVERAELR